ncbi:MAG: transcriptional repressor [Chloroflexi bacterium]|nr:transcriptional repressor [Chloroflexota bacterium]
MTVDRLAHILRGHGLKLTSQRRAVLKVIAGSHGHLTPAAIYELVRKEYPTIGLVTVYRMLEVLAELDLVCRVHGETTCRSYMMRRPSGHHHHIVCSSCGKVVDFARCALDELQHRLSRETGFKIQGHLLEFSGLCQGCLGETAAEDHR